MILDETPLEKVGKDEGRGVLIDVLGASSFDAALFESGGEAEEEMEVSAKEVVIACFVANLSLHRPLFGSIKESMSGDGVADLRLWRREAIEDRSSEEYTVEAELGCEDDNVALGDVIVEDEGVEEVENVTEVVAEAVGVDTERDIKVSSGGLPDADNAVFSGIVEIILSIADDAILLSSSSRC